VLRRSLSIARHPFRAARTSLLIRTISFDPVAALVGPRSAPRTPARSRSAICSPSGILGVLSTANDPATQQPPRCLLARLNADASNNPPAAGRCSVRWRDSCETPLKSGRSQRAGRRNHEPQREPYGQENHEGAGVTTG